MAEVNRMITLASRPLGLPTVSDFELVYSAVPSPGPGKVLVRSVYLSLDPYMRGQMNGACRHARPFAIGAVVGGRAVAYVVDSEDPSFRAGDAVEGMLGWQEFAVAPARELRKIDPGLAPISTALGVLGIPGLTALFGLMDICDPRQGETAVVSGAAGAVGMLVGQIAKIRGCRVVGVAGSDAKSAWLLDELGFDAALNYTADGGFEDRLRTLCPDGIDVYFDNVGGAVTDAVVQQLGMRARICLCGELSQYNLERPEMGPRWLGQLIAKQARMQGFLISGHVERFSEGLEQLATWLEEGKLKYREDVAQGLEATPQAFIGMLQGKNQGKQLVRLSES